MNNEKQLKEQIDSLNQRIKTLQEQAESAEHQNKKALIEVKTQLQFQTRKADQYEQKYKESLKYQNQEQSLKELDEKLRNQQNQLIRLLHLDHEKTQEIQGLMEQVQEMKKQNNDLVSDLNQIKQAALTAIVDKDTTIAQLTQKLDEYQDVNGVNELKSVIIELQEKYHEFQQKTQSSRAQYESIIEGKEEEINELHQKLNNLKEKHEERVSRFEQDIAYYEKHIEQMAIEKDHEQNLEQKYYHLQQKLRKTQKKLVQLQQSSHQQRNELIQAIAKLEQQNQNTKGLSDELKEIKSKFKALEKENLTLKKQGDESKEKIQKLIQENHKKIAQIENQKKIMGDNLTIKSTEIEKLKAQLQEKKLQIQPSLSGTTQKKESQDQSMIEKLKKQNKDLQQINEALKKKIEDQTKELQQSRQKLLQARGSESNVQVNKFRVQIQQLTSYLKKVQNDMLMKKITHAEDENFWSIKQKKYKAQIQTLNKKFRKQNSELLERIDRMKKLIPKDKKTDYYQSGFK